jgi:hypothetical protein
MQTLSYVSPRAKKQKFDNFDAKDYKSLGLLGIHVSDRFISQAMDSLQPTVTSPSMTTPIQFMQYFLPGHVNIATSARRADTFVGKSSEARWEDQEIVQQVMETLGYAAPYSDITNPVLSGYNVNYERRTIVRFEQALMVGYLEQLRASAANVNADASKRTAALQSLEIERNRVAFYGFNDGNGRTYGLLNDPTLPAYQTVKLGLSGSTFWSTKSMLEIQSDLLTGFQNLRTNSGEVVDPKETMITIGVATDAVDDLSTPTQFGYSIQAWLAANYPKTRITSAPEFNGANGGQNVFYMYAETVDDYSTDDGLVFKQVVPATDLFVGVEQRAKGYVEVHANATAGVYCKRGFAVYRASGI